MTETYRSILAELAKRRDVLAAELSGVNAAIAAIMPLVAGESPAPRPVEVPLTGVTAPVAVGPLEALIPQVGDYARLSVRWAALWHLAEFAPSPLRNGEIAEAIRLGGYHSGAESFPNAVSAVLSGMRAKGEIDGNPETGYFLTDKGREIWRSIRKSDRFRSAMARSFSTTEPLLLSSQ